MKELLKLLSLLLLPFSILAQVEEFPSGVSFVDINGNAHNIDEYLADDKQVVIQFFETWCPFCWDLYQSQQLVALHNTFGFSGTDEMRVLMVELEGQVIDSCDGIPALDGSAAASCTRGDWLTDNPIPVVDIDNDFSLFLIDILVGFTGVPYTVSICPDGSYQYWSSFGQGDALQNWIVEHFYTCKTETSCTAVLTAEESTIIIPAAATPVINNEPLPIGSIIQVVYQVDGVKSCAGQTTWTGENTYINVAGNDAILPALNGYQEGQEYTYCFLLPSGCIIEDVAATYLSGPLFDAADDFVSDGISGIQTLTATQDFTLQVDIVSADTCEATIGIFEVSPLNGALPVVYTWSNGMAGNRLEGLSGGDTFTVQAVDNNGCSAITDQNIMLSSPCPPIQCNGQCNGNPVGTLTAGCIPFEVNFQNQSVAEAGTDSLIWRFGDGDELANAQNPVHLYDSVGLFTATLLIYDGFQYDSVDFEIQVFPSPDVNAVEIIYDNCNTTAVNLSTTTLSGIIEDWNWNFEDGNIVSTMNTSQSSQVQVDFPAADSSYAFELEVLDENACTNIITDTVQTPSTTAITIETVLEEPSCAAFNGSLSVEPQGGFGDYIYLWNTGVEDNILENIGAGVYFLTITDAENCEEIFEITLPGQDPFEPNINISYGCGDGNIFVQTNPVNGLEPFTYNWSTGSTNDFLFNMPAGDYSVTMTDDNDCEVVQNFTIDFVPTLVIDYEVTALSCFGAQDGAVELFITGGLEPYTINWNNGSGEIVLTNLPSGNYQVDVTAGSCGKTVALTVNEPPPLTVEVIFTETPQNTVDALAIPTGGTAPYTILWSTGTIGNMEFDIQFGANLSLIIEDANGCLYEEEFIVNSTINKPKIADNFFVVAPNPSNGLVHILMEEESQGLVQVQVFNTQGQLVLVEKDRSVNDLQLDLTSFAKGIYFVLIERESSTGVQKIVLH